MATIIEKTIVSTTFHDCSTAESTEYQSEDQDINQFGYKPELRRRFGLWSMIGLSSTIMVTWEGWFTTSNISMINGGKAGSVYSFLFCWIGYATVVASLAELISMIPTAGGQYHWTFELAPARYRQFISWITGM
jgi:choline transport protein